MPDAAQATQVTEDEVLDHITLQVSHDQSECQEHQRTKVTIVVILADRDCASELDTIAMDVEDGQASPLVRIPARRSPTHREVHDDSEQPDRAEAEKEHLRRVLIAVGQVHNDLFRHAAERVEDKLTAKGALHIVVCEVVAKDFERVIEEVPLLGAVDHARQLLVGAAEPHHETRVQEEQQVVEADDRIKALLWRRVGLGLLCSSFCGNFLLT